MPTKENGKRRRVRRDRGSGGITETALAIAKRAGFSLDEMNEMSLSVIYGVAEILCGGGDSGEKRGKGKEKDETVYYGRLSEL